MKKGTRLLLPLASTLVLFVAGCDKATTPLAERHEMNSSDPGLLQVTAPISSIFAGVVTDATDLNNASFGRPPSEWIGKRIVGTFSIQLSTPGLGDRDPDPDVWVIGPVPGPGPFIEFVAFTALIDGKSFRTSRADYTHVFFGDVLSIRDSDVDSWFRPQDSYVGVGGAGTGRSIVGLNAFFGPGGLSFDGSSLAIDPRQLQWGEGVIDDLLENGAIVHRQGTIRFRLTRVSISVVAPLVQKLIEVSEGAGGLQPNQVKGLMSKAMETAARLEAGNIRAACNQLGAFVNQARGLIAAGHLTTSGAGSLIHEAEGLAEALTCSLRGEARR